MLGRLSALALMVAVAGAFVAGCGNDRPRTDAELGLDDQQAAGRALFDHYCSACHNAYSSGDKKGPSLRKLFGKEFLPSGLPANERFVRQTIAGGRGMMPEFGDALTPDQMNALLAYLHTL
ncbi:MAG TPA: cytochrome c [Candidatus Aquilonibacter sp.]|nr:cytochrome c [Candidatus Aquilonibacter sp.]